ncbi:hypothetical protein SUGI_0602090 [Cryptomeria japonica]|nr:hypothetical protein SUGI_0602090 [Cryptomeria japonica]
MAFFGAITEKRLTEITFFSHELFINALCDILGVEFLFADYIFWVNLDIPAQFLATILMVEEPKIKAQILGKRIFKRDFLGDKEWVLEEIDLNHNIPFAKDFGVPMKDRKPTPSFPILVIINQDLWQVRKSIIRMTIDFMKRLMGFKKMAHWLLQLVMQ